MRDNVSPLGWSAPWVGLEERYSDGVCRWQRHCSSFPDQLASFLCRTTVDNNILSSCLDGLITGESSKTF